MPGRSASVVLRNAVGEVEQIVGQVSRGVGVWLVGESPRCAGVSNGQRSAI